MEKTPDGWKAFDIAVEGVSLVTNYRNSFNSIAEQSGIDGLIKSLAEKNKSNAAQ
jgi:phospholipid transport system substrate-binding protein